MAQTSADWFLDKTFKLTKPLSFYKAVDSSGNGIDLLREMQPDEIIKIDSYLDRTKTPCGCVWFSTYDPVSKRSYYFKYENHTLEWLKNYEQYQPTDHFTTNIIDTGAFGNAISETIKPVAKWVLGIAVATIVSREVAKVVFKNKK